VFLELLKTYGPVVASVIGSAGATAAAFWRWYQPTKQLAQDFRGDGNGSGVPCMLKDIRADLREIRTEQREHRVCLRNLDDRLDRLESGPPLPTLRLPPPPFLPQ
jgi:hypothetical protein